MRFERKSEKAATERSIARINSHTATAVNTAADRVIGAVSQTIQSATSDSSQFFQSVGGVGSSQELRTEAAVLRARATEKAKEERKLKREAEKAEGRTESTNAAPRPKRAKTVSSNEYEDKSMAELRQLLTEKGLDTKSQKRSYK